MSSYLAYEIRIKGVSIRAWQRHCS